MKRNVGGHRRMTRKLTKNTKNGSRQSTDRVLTSLTKPLTKANTHTKMFVGLQGLVYDILKADLLSR